MVEKLFIEFVILLDFRSYFTLRWALSISKQIKYHWKYEKWYLLETKFWQALKIDFVAEKLFHFFDKIGYSKTPRSENENPSMNLYIYDLPSQDQKSDLEKTTSKCQKWPLETPGGIPNVMVSNTICRIKI